MYIFAPYNKHIENKNAYAAQDLFNRYNVGPSFTN